jgi:SSS family solute:Na+ symporter
MAARVGFVSGAVTKRLLMIGWAFTGLLAIGLYSGHVSDPTNVWGLMTRDLLGAGAIGLMIAAIFSASMDGNSTISLDASAAVIKNIVEPLFPGVAERTQVLVGRVIVFAILVSSIYFADRLDDLLVVFKYILSIGTVVGPSFWLVYFWRRLNTRAVAVQMIISIILTILLPNLVPKIEGMSRSKALTAQTVERVVTVERPASEEDVRAGAAAATGVMIRRSERVPPAAIYFETVRRNDSLGIWEGTGLFRPQIWILSRCGIDFTTWSRASISTASFLFDAIVPFLILIAVSLLTRRNSEEVLRDFYARVHTPAVADPELDARLVREKIEHPELVERNKLFPGTDWELWRPTRVDTLGFIACVLFVLVIIGLYSIVASLAS